MATIHRTAGPTSSSHRSSYGGGDGDGFGCLILIIAFIIGTIILTFI